MAEFNPQSIETCVIAGCTGYLIIGDPWLGAERRVGRVDNTWEASLAKLSQALKIATERKLVPVILGDLLHESRDLSKVLAIINLIKGHQAVLVPRDARWGDRASGHIAAILQASGVAHVAGFSAKRYQVQVSIEQKWVNLDLECHTSWGGYKRLDQGSRAKVVMPSLNLVAEPDSAIPTMTAEGSHTLIKAGRLIRLTAMEESQHINVFAVTRDGIETIALNITPIVFTEASANADSLQHMLAKDSTFVERLRASSQESLAEEGKEGIVDLIGDVCKEIGADKGIESILYELAKDLSGPAQ